MKKHSGRGPRYASVPNETVDDAGSLDLMALGLLTVLLRHRDGWDIRLADIAAKYGYGEDAMAAAMGLLQVARYVVKVRTMGAGNRWSTTMVVYDSPATDDEIAAVIEEIRAEDPAITRAEVIPPTPKAIERARKRCQKLAKKLAAPRLREFPDPGATWENAAKPQVAPESGVSRVPGDPGVSKKTISKKTREDDSAGFRPSVPSPTERANHADDGRTDGNESVSGEAGRPGPETGRGDSQSPVSNGAPTVPQTMEEPEPIEVTPGVAVLLAIGQEFPELRLSGKTLAHQGLRVTGMLASGWTPAQIRHIVAGQPLPNPIRKTVGAVLSKRLKDASSTPAPATVPGIPAPTSGAVWGTPAQPEAAPAASRRTVAQEFERRVHRECETCGVPVLTAHDECPRCLGWDRCTDCNRYVDPVLNSDRCGQCEIGTYGTWDDTAPPF